jgi:hypothetical protein
MSFASVSSELVAFLNSKTEFTSVMSSKVFPIAATEDELTPFTTYRVISGSGISKDADSYAIALAFWFDVESYKTCVEFLDVMTEIFKDSNYEWVSSEPDFNEESYTYSGIINLTI